jgi:hypothetical protein
MTYCTKALRGLLGALAMVAINACGHSDPPKPTLLQDTATEDAELKRLRDLQKIHLIAKDGSGVGLDVSPDTVADNVKGKCYPKATGNTQDSVCDGILGQILVDVCVASFVEQAAISEATPTIEVFNPNISTTEWLIPPQDTNARLGLLLQAKDYYEGAIVGAAWGLEGGTCNAVHLVQRSNYATHVANDVGNSPEPENTIGGLYSASIAQIWTSLNRLAQELAQVGAAAGDSQRGGAPSYAIGTDRSFAGMQLSRAAIAHQLIQTAAGTKGSATVTYFGDNGVAGSTKAPCRQLALDQNGRQALALLRTTGVAPDDVLAMPDFQARLTQDTNGNLLSGASVRNISTKHLLDGNADLVGPSVLARLNNDAKRTDIVSVTDETGLPLDAFDKARIALGEELLAFGRLSSDRLIDPTAPADLQPFAATRNEPKALPAEYYSALVRTPVNCINCNLDSLPQTTESYYELDKDSVAYGNAPDIYYTMKSSVEGGQIGFSPGIFGLYDGIDTSVVRLLTQLRWLAQRVSVGVGNSYEPNFGTYSDSSVQQVIAPSLSLVLGDKTIIGALSLLSESGNIASFDLEGFSSADRPIIVRGESALLCATTGSVYGNTDCSLSLPETLDQETPFSFNSVHGANGTANLFDNGVYSTGIKLPSKVERWYLLIPKDNSKSVLGRGDYKVLLGFVPNTSGQGLNQRQWWPISPQLEKLAGELVEPQPGECSQPAVSCAGIRYDARIALEDELSSDGSDTESSWKTYLQRAAEAATLSDQLTQDYIQAGLQQDQWTVTDEDRQRSREQSAIAELDKLQNICGTSIDPETLLAVLRAGGDTVDLKSGNAGTCSNGQSATNSDCVANQLILNWLKVLQSSDAAKPLADCLQSITDRIPIVAIGSSLPCAWRDANGAVCGGSSASLPCPVFAKNADCSDGQSPSGATWLTGPNDRAALGLFASDPAVNNGTQGGSELCKRIRTARENPAAYAGSPNMIQSQDFSLPSLSSLRKRVTLNAELGGYYTLYLDGRAAGTTGSSLSGPELNTWPCGTEHMPKDCATSTYPSSFHCASYSCVDTPTRGKANRRLLEAFAMIQATTWRLNDPLPVLSIPEWTELRSLVLLSPNTVNVKDGNSLIAVDCYNGAHWKAYDLPSTFAPFVMEMAQAPANSGYWDSNGIWSGNIGDLRFAIGNATLSTKSTGFGDLATEVWDGMSANAQSTSGFLYGYLKGSGKWAALPHLLADPDQFLLNVGLAPFSLKPTRDSILDAAEFLCDVSVGDVATGGSCLDYVDITGKVTNVNDMESLAAYLKCEADLISTRTAAAAFVDFPQAALDPLQRLSSGPYATESGEIGQAYSELRQAAGQVALSGPILAGAVRSFGGDLELLKEELQLYGIQDQMAQVKSEQDMANAMIGCASGIASAIATLGAGSGGAAAACGNLATTAYFSQKLLELNDAATAVQRQMAMTRYQQAFNGYITTLQTEEVKLRQALESIRARLGKIDSLKETAARSLTAAVWDLSKQSTVAAGVATVLGKQRTTAQERYRSAYDNAVRLAFLSKRAIEQRLGMKLSSMTEDLPLVDAPARWESSICASTPVDYTALQKQDSSVKSYADSFIGDYVRKLGNVVESYRQQYPFHEGSDVLVASLRDDVMGVKAPCQVKSRNLLVNASRPDIFGIEGDTHLTGWAAIGCNVGSVSDLDGGTTTQALPNCAFASLWPDSVAGTASILLSFANGGTCTSADCGWNSNVVFGQRLTLTPGIYVLSWYEEVPDDYYASPKVMKEDGTAVSSVYKSKQELEGNFHRGWLRFEVTDTGNYVIGFQPGSTTHPWEAVIAAPMLEQIQNAVQGSDLSPGIFEDSDNLGNATATVCQDSDGRAFRASRWRRGCDVLCNNGFGTSCAGNTPGTQYCYWETNFSIRQKDIASSAIFKQSGFARGNFNYRVQSLALNFVGTGLQACNGSSQACYAGGYIPYTIIHEGPYYVRNHLGEDFEALLFTGRIEHARGLGAERYITNPISSTDLSLLQNYMRPEFSGRPLDGTFIIRVWDENNLNFDAIQDVQLVMNYRYWTRFQ